MSRVVVIIALLTSAWTAVLGGSAAAEDMHSENMSLVATYNEGETHGPGSDEAFWGTTAVLGSYSGPGGFRLVDISNPAAPRRIGLFNCQGGQADVSIWKDLVFVSVDSPRGPFTDSAGNPHKAEECGAGPATDADNQTGVSWEGVRIVSIANPANPVQVAAVKTDCGSHTHTIVPDEAHNRVLVWVLSYPLTGQHANCNGLSHRKISVIEVPLSAPQNAKVVSTPSVSPAVGCHDSTIFVPRKLAVAACISESQVWDVSDPVNPKILAHIHNPRINIHHSSTFSWDGNTVVLGDELGGAEAAPGCIGPEQSYLGGLWFYDIKDPANPVQVGAFKLPQQLANELCTAHLFNAIPLRSDKDILVASWYTGATTVVDFTDPAHAKQIAYYIPSGPVSPGTEDREAVAWSSYWYNGNAYSNNFSKSTDPRGMDVFGLKIPELADEIRLDHLNPQVQEPLPAPTSTAGGGQFVRLPRTCKSRRHFIITLFHPRRARVVSAVVFVNGRRVRALNGKRLRAKVDLRGLPKGRFRVDITLRLRSGKRIHSTRSYRTCTPKEHA